MNGEMPYEFDSLDELSISRLCDDGNTLALLYFYNNQFPCVEKINPMPEGSPMDSTIISLFANVIHTAITHTHGVVNREHVKADRNERVGQFLTSLRRELTYIRNGSGLCESDFLQIQQSLLRREVWYDVGQLNTDITGVGFFSYSFLKSLVDAANRSRHSVDGSVREIQGDLDGLESILRGANLAVSDAQTVNREAEVVIGDFCKLFG